MNPTIIQEGDGWRFYVCLDEVMYDDSYIDTWDNLSDEEKAKAKTEVWERIEREGVWGIVGEVACSACDNWVHVDSIGGFIGQDWKNSGYDADVLQACQKEAARLKAEKQPLIDERFGEVILGKLGPEKRFIFADDGTIAARIDDDGTVRIASR